MRRESELCDIVERLGWRMTRTTKGFAVYPPDGSRPIQIHLGKHTDWRAIRNTKAQLRRAGAKI